MYTCIDVSSLHILIWVKCLPLDRIGNWLLIVGIYI